MSWHFSRALVEEYLEGTCSAGAQSVPLNTNHTPLLYSSSDRMMDFSRRSRSGMTCEPLTVSLGEDVLTWFLEGFPARTSVQLAAATGSRGKGLGSGRKWHGSFAKFDHNTCSWKIPHCLPLVGSMSFSATWPRWGSMRNGACMAQPMPGLRIKGTGSGYWPTPKASDGSHGGPNMRGSKGELALPSAVHRFPTPQSRAFRTGEGQRWESSERSRNLNDFAAKFPTPCAQDAKNSTLPISLRDRDSIPGYLLSTGETPGGQLNPDWVEWLMGWPIGWTDLGPLNLEIFHEWQREFRIESADSRESETDRFRRAL